MPPESGALTDDGSPINATGQVYDGTTIAGPADLRAAVLRHQDAFLLSFTESLMTYALGRRLEPHDMPTVRRIIRDAATQRVPHERVPDRHRQEPGVLRRHARRLDTAATTATVSRER